MVNHLDVEVLSEKTLQHAVDPRLISYCPSMDLVALVTTDQQVFIYRMNGQRVYSTLQKAGDLRVESIQWKPNGQLLAIAWSDGSIRLVGAESNKIVHQFTTVEGSEGITCVGWTKNTTTRTSSSVNIHQGPKTWEDLLGVDHRVSGVAFPLDLPQDLSLIDIEISLPKLSVLASTGSLNDVFCSRSSLDDLFRPFDPKDNNSVDVMVTGTREGEIHLSIYDSFVIGSFKSPSTTPDCSSQLVLHAADKECSTHALLMKPSNSENLFFVPMDLRFISISSEYLSLLASRSTALHNLLRYIHQVQTLIVVEWKATRDLPSRFIRGISETLSEKDNRNIVQALYHSVATGHTFPAVREWLVDELSERGHKRWDKAVTTGLENLRRLVHENMLPALERCSVILSRFAGIARFRGSNDAARFSAHQINVMIDSVACIHLISSKILIQVVDELELFTSFSAWLRYEIDRLASGSASTSDDAVEKEAAIDHSKVLLYLQKMMTTNPLSIFFPDSKSEPENGDSHANQGFPLFDLLSRQLEKQERHLPYIKSLLRIDILCASLTHQADTIFSQIAEAEKRNVLFGKALDIGTPESHCPVDMKMSKLESSMCQTHIVYVPKDLPNTIYLNRITLSIDGGLSSLERKELAAVALGTGQVKGVKLLDDCMLLVLWKLDSKTHLISFPYNDPTGTLKAEFGNFEAIYLPQTPDMQQVQLTSLSDKEVMSLFARINGSFERSFSPDWIGVRTPRNMSEKEDTRRIITLSKDRLHYKILRISTNVVKKETRDNRDEDMPMV